MLQQGSSNAQIATELQVSVETIRTHARNMYRKLGVASRRELATMSPQARRKDAAGAPKRPACRRVTSTRACQRRPGSMRR